MAAFGTLVSLECVILPLDREITNNNYLEKVITHFFSPSRRRNASKVAGAFISGVRDTLACTRVPASNMTI